MPSLEPRMPPEMARGEHPPDPQPSAPQHQELRSENTGADSGSASDSATRDDPAEELSLFKVPFFGKLLLAAFLVSLATPAYVLWVVYPSFGQALVQISEEEAIRVGSHLASTVLREVSTINRQSLADTHLHEYLQQAVREMDLFNLHLFSASGEILYSHDPREIGRINTHEYFWQQVAKGNVFSNLIEQYDRTAEGQEIGLYDVVETYIPILRQGQFLGALEIYYDISARKRDQERRLFVTSLFLYLLAFGALGFLAIATYRAALNYREQQRARATIAELSHQHERLLNALGEGVFGVDRQGRFTFVNRAARHLLGIDEDADPIGSDYCHGLSHFTRPEQRGLLSSKTGNALEECPIQRVIESGKPLEEWKKDQFWRANGESFPVEIYAAPIHEEDGAVQGAVVAFADITERKRAEENLIAAHRRAEAANQAKSAFLANMSHELRTPLNAILGYAQILRRDPNLGPEHRQGAAAIQRSGDYLLTLINDILDLAKIEAGRFELAPGPCDLRALLSSFEDLFGIRAREKGIGFRCRLVEPLPVLVEADERRLRQIVINLLGNAVKFTERGEVCLQAAFAEGQLELEIADTGIGIAAGRLETLFQPFEQAGERDYRRQGTGLGLAITKSLVDQMGGRITIESTPGQGTRFRVNLPLAVRTGEPVMVSQNHQCGIGGYRRGDGRHESLKILIADDVADNRAMLRQLLESFGFATVEARNGEEALASAWSHSPDAILMDLVMPGLDGLETTQRLKRSPYLRQIPIIACTARAFAEDREKAQAAGCDDLIHKPIQIEELCAALARQLELRWLPMENRETGDGCAARPETPDARLTSAQRGEFLAMARRGNITGLRKALDGLPADKGGELCRLRELVRRFDLKGVKRLLDDPAP